MCRILVTRWSGHLLIWDGLDMTTYAVNAETNASTRYTDYGFDSFCRAPDGRYFGVKSDGLYLLEGTTASEVDFGDINFATSVRKAVPAVYVTCAAEDKLTLGVVARGNVYWYESSGYTEQLSAQRFSPGKGLRENYFGVKIGNIDQSDWTIDSIELAAIPLSRRI